MPDRTHLERVVQTYRDFKGNRSDAARHLGLSRTTYNDQLRSAEKVLGVAVGRVADGQVAAARPAPFRLPRKGHRMHFLCTSAQNNTHVHPAWHNVEALAEWLEDKEGHCEILVGTFSYQKGSNGEKSVKRGSLKGDEHQVLWYDPALEPYIYDQSRALAPGLIWAGEMNILPTTKYPLTSLERYNGRKSNVVPHAKISMRSVASMRDEATKFNYTTGACTLRNYIQKKAGIVAEQEHDYGLLHIEVNEWGNWYVRQVYFGADDELFLIPPTGTADLSLRVQAGEVTDGHALAGILWGDAHVCEMAPWVADLTWGDGGMLDSLQPEYQFFGDLASMRSRSPHEEKNFHAQYRKFRGHIASVEAELRECAAFMHRAHRDWCKSVVIRGNHDLHFERWLNEADFRRDPLNAKFFHQANYNLLDAIDQGDTDFKVLEWALRSLKAPDDVVYLGEDDSFVLCEEYGGGVEHGLHGHLGPDGARGSTRNLTKLARPINKAHDHKAGIELNAMSAGTCALDLCYQRGPSSHSVSHVATFPNATRSLVTMYADRWRA